MRALDGSARSREDAGEVDRITKALAQWRERKETLPLRQIALATGRSVRTVQRWFNGENAGDAVPISALRAMELIRPGLIAALFPELRRSWMARTRRSGRVKAVQKRQAARSPRAGG